MKADVLFIHPGDQKRTYQALANEFTAIATPVWTSLLAARVRQSGFTPAVYDVNVEGWDETLPAELLARWNPELIVLMVYGHTPSASTQTMPAAGRIARDLKRANPALPIAMGGIHPSALPERTLREETIDFVIAGEGVYTIEALLRYLRGTLAKEAVPGLWFRQDSGASHTAPAPIVHDLDADLPDYAWDLLPDLHRYRAHNMHCFQDFERSRRPDFSDVRSPYVALNTSLGCPYNCHYCCINSIFGKPGIRYWSEERVLSWIDGLARKGVRNFRFDDELFILSPRRVQTLCAMLIERAYDLNIWVYGRVDTVKPGLLKTLRRAGFRWICLGIESANERVRNDVNKTIRSDIISVVHAIQGEDMYVLGNYMLGLPEDDRATMEETLQLAMDLNCEFANLYTVMALPGSRLYAWAEEHPGTLPPSWGAFSQHSVDTQPMPTKHLSAAEVLRFRDEAFRRYFQRDEYLDMIQKRFGTKVLQHIRQMLEVRIERRLVTSAAATGPGGRAP